MFERLEGEECIIAKGRKARCEPGSLGGKLTRDTSSIGTSVVSLRGFYSCLL